MSERELASPGRASTASATDHLRRQEQDALHSPDFVIQLTIFSQRQNIPAKVGVSATFSHTGEAKESENSKTVSTRGEDDCYGRISPIPVAYRAI